MNKDSVKAWSLIVQIGVSMIVPILICLFLGKWLDNVFGTSPVIMIIFIILGVFAGFRSVYMLTLGFHKDKDKYIDMEKYKDKDKNNG